MMFDTIRLCCGGAEHHKPIKRSQGGSSSHHYSNQVDTSMTSDFKQPDLLVTDEFGTYEGSSNGNDQHETPVKYRSEEKNNRRSYS